MIGVHSGKFLAERVTENIRQAVLRLGITHPVVNDRQFRVWRSYAIGAWPTLALIDPTGRVVGQHAGEISAAELAPVLEAQIETATDRGLLDPTLRTFAPEREPARALAYPAKVLADSASDRLFVSDTGHNRVLVVRLAGDGAAGEVEAVIGGGEPGRIDGGFDEATFRAPHGLALTDGKLYVADTENHAIRVVDLEAGRVETLAGTGVQARQFNVAGRGRDVALNSPWDLLLLGDALYIAMAGSHQIWRLDLESLEAAPWAGSGAEALHDDALPSAALAQPSGLATDGQRLFFADSESSAIRWADLGPGGGVHTIVGTGLFDFGDRDGAGDEVRLQHPLGVAWHDGMAYVADTYNGKIKVLDPGRREVRTWLGDGGEFWERGGITVAGDRVYIADTNHHRIAVARAGTDLVDTVEIRGL